MSESPGKVVQPVEDGVDGTPLGRGITVAPSPQPPPAKGWVQFEEDKETKAQEGPAVINTESVQVNLERSLSKSMTQETPSNVAILDPKPLRNVELPIATVEPIRQGFTNGDIIVTLLPVNSKFPWITPAKFRPELVPEELMAQGLTLTVEEYVQAMELLVNDVRFSLYNVCYKRVLVLWITFSFCILLGLLFSGLSGLSLFGLGIGWLIFNAAAIFLSMYVKFRLQRNLERCLAHVNKQLLRHKIVIALDDRGKISCHKVNLCFLYLDSAPCIAHMQTVVEQQERDPSSGWEQRMDIAANDIVIQGSRTTRLSRKQLTVEEYVQAMELLVNDVRFSLYNVCYKRVLVLWITFSFCILLGLLFSGLSGLSLFGLGIGWLIFNAAAIFLSMYVKFRLQRNLERCLAHVNKQLLRHKIVIALDDRGKISCHKVNLCFLYLDSAPCIAHMQTVVEQQERDPSSGWEQRMDIAANDIVIQGSRTTRLSRKQGRAEQLYLRYLQRWGKDFLRRRLDWTLDEILGNPANPRHIQSSLCVCQYVEDIMANKPAKTDEGRDCCPVWSRLMTRLGIY